MNYSADSIKTLDFKQAIRKRIEMYMGSADNQGVIQCVREVISNSIDEYSIGFGKEIQITLQNNIFTCRDFGRSIPFGKRDDGTEAMIAIFTMPHTGGKFNDKMYGNAVIGQNGTGLKGVALSAEYFVAKSYRDGKCAFLRIENGDVIEYKVEKSTEKTGTYIEFKPSQEVYRLEPIKIEYSIIKEMCEEWSYLNKGLKFVLSNGEKETIYFSKNGITDFIKTKVKPTIQMEPYFYCLEDDEGNKVEIAFQWGSKKEKSYTFTNGLHNINGGTSLTGAKTAITRTINNLSKQNYSGDFVRDSLCYVINAKVPHASFSDQTKTRVNNLALRPLTDKAFTEGIKEFASHKKEDFEKVLAYLNKIEKAEAAASRARDAILAHESEIVIASKKKMSMPIKLMDCEKHGENSILYITEGKSSKTPVQNARKISDEAVYDIRGKIISALKNPIDKVLENEEVKDILQILNCGIFEKYNSKKLNFGKVLIFSDRDADGAAISNLLVTLFYVLTPDFIKEGRLGRIIPPLFRVRKGKQNIYFYSNEEYLKEKDKYSGWETTRFKGLGECSTQDFKNTCFNDKERRVHIYTPNDFALFEETINLLMGPEVPQRREYIFENLDFHRLLSEE